MKMVLDSLKQMDSRTREGVLTTLAGSFLPSPNVESKTSTSSLSEKYQSLLPRLMNEIKGELSIEGDLFSNQERSKVYEYISKLMTQVSSLDDNAVRDRIGQKGILWPSGYKHEFEKSALTCIKSFGIRKNHIESVLVNPQYVEHLLPEENGLSSESAVSLYAQTNLNKDSYTYLVLAFRKGSIQNITVVFKVYHSDVEISNETSPLEMLKKLISVYGYDLECNDRISKFFYHERIKGSNGNNDIKAFSLKANQDQTHFKGKIMNNFMCRTIDVDGENYLEIAMLFSLDLTLYENDLAQHG